MLLFFQTSIHVPPVWYANHSNGWVSPCPRLWVLFQVFERQPPHEEEAETAVYVEVYRAHPAHRVRRTARVYSLLRR